MLLVLGCGVCAGWRVDAGLALVVVFVLVTGRPGAVRAVLELRRPVKVRLCTPAFLTLL